MNQIAAIVLTCIVVMICMAMFYYYMNWVRDQYIDFDKGKLEEIPSYALPVWARDAWDPTWAYIMRTNVKLGVYLR
jgi:hypothetical protein